MAIKVIYSSVIIKNKKSDIEGNTYSNDNNCMFQSEQENQVVCLQLLLIKSQDYTYRILYHQNEIPLSKMYSHNQGQDQHQQQLAPSRCDTQLIATKIIDIKYFKMAAQYYFNTLREGSINCIAQKQDQVDQLKNQMEAQAQKFKQQKLDSQQMLQKLQTRINMLELKLEDQLKRSKPSTQ